MNPAAIRRWLHHLFAVLSVVLLASGLLLTLPDLRAKLVGGYGRQILDIHIWLGWAYLALPALALAAAARALLRDLSRRLRKPVATTWSRIYILFSLASGVLFAVTGVLLWLDPGLSRAAVDALVELHEVFSWALLAVIPAHLLAARRGIAAGTLKILRWGQSSSASF
ncbi:cytochrome b/b6 domain-containing protein [bacterium]|nr:cytochrome b/b6 domain-containing protein [bacterium]